MIMEIKSTAEITEQDLNDLIAENVVYEIRIKDDKHYPKGKTYDIYTLLSIKRKIKEFLKDCPYPNPGNPNSEKVIFSCIYTKLAFFAEYDDLAADVMDANRRAIQHADEYLEQSASLEGLLIGGRALCSGFAETLRNLLAERGIESKYISGTISGTKENGKKNYHAWNQVKLDGEWFNCDITHDRKFVIEGLIAPNFLKSNKTFMELGKYPTTSAVKLEKATKDITVEEQNNFIRPWRLAIMAEKSEREKEENKKKPGFIKAIITKFQAKGRERKN